MLSNTEAEWAVIKEPFLSASGADLNSCDISDPVSHVREGCGHNGAHNNLYSLYNLNKFFVFEPGREGRRQGGIEGGKE